MPHAPVFQNLWFGTCLSTHATALLSTAHVEYLIVRTTALSCMSVFVIMIAF